MGGGKFFFFLNFKKKFINKKICTEDILVENITVINGVGMSIGSVPPHKNINCIRNVVFRNIYFLYPFKGIYIKTNSGDPNGTGLI